MTPTPRQIEVDGQRFSVEADGDTLHFTWLNGSRPDYGFSSRPHDPADTTDAELARLIRAFLDQVGPAGVID